MNTKNYLQRLQTQLDGFSPEDQAGLLEEIAAHIEEGENDPQLGQLADDRSSRLEQELGSPDDLGRGLRQVHRPRRWWDVLLVLLPTFLIFPLMTLVSYWIAGGVPQVISDSNQAGSMWWIGIRVSLIVHAAIILLSFWKGSSGVLIYWQVSFLLSVLSLILSGRYWPWLPAGLGIQNTINLPEVFMWLVVIAFLNVWLVRLLQKTRNEPMFLVMAGCLVLIAFANYIASLTIVQFNIQHLDFFNPILGYLGLTQLAELVWPLMFFLPSQRDIRWAGLLLMPLAVLLTNAWAYRSFPLVIIVYSLPLLLIVYAWIRDFHERLTLATN